MIHKQDYTLDISIIKPAQMPSTTIDKVLLPIKRYKQKPAECAIAACAAVAYYYDSTVTYENARQLVEQPSDGLYTGEIGILLNDLGFNNITIVCANTEILDPTWNGLSRRQLLSRMRKSRTLERRRKKHDAANELAAYVKWMSRDDCNNRLIIESSCSKWIRSYLRRSKPVITGINWSAMFGYKRSGGSSYGIGGATEYHSIVLRGFDSQKVFCVDSHTQNYRGRLSKFRTGYYTLSWEKLLSNVTNSELVAIDTA